MRPNIVLITADQWRGDCLGYVRGRHPVMTPHLNQLAAEGVSFSQAYADCPVCMPQRVTLLTGQVASRFGLPHNFQVRSPVNARLSLPMRLAREAGYQTEAIGKMHFSPDRARLGFEHVRLHPDDYVIWLEDQGYGGFYRGHGLGGNEVYPVSSAVPERFTHVHWIVEEGIRFLTQRDPEAPFFLWMVFEAPHSPFDPPDPFDRLYDHMTIPEPVKGDWVNESDYPPGFRARCLAAKYDLLNGEMIRESRRRYYGQISHIDYQLGRFLGELRSKGLYENTAIIFTSDHGEHLGDHGLFGKATFLHGSGDVPLVMRLPSSVPLAHPALELSTPVLTADIYPTILALAGLEPTSEVDGRSLLSVLEAGQGEARIMCGECGRNDSTAFITDGCYKYIYYILGGVEQLFDVGQDAENLHNLANDPAYSPTKDALRDALIAYLMRFDRPIVCDGQLVAQARDLDEVSLRAQNTAAWRGPLRYGQGYGGGW